nr:hypothetical protein [uncultured bacterium]
MRELLREELEKLPSDDVRTMLLAASFWLSSNRKTGMKMFTGKAGTDPDAARIVQEIDRIREGNEGHISLRKFARISDKAKTIFLAKVIVKMETDTEEITDNFRKAPSARKLKDYGQHVCGLINEHGILGGMRRHAMRAFNDMADASKSDIRIRQLDDGGWGTDTGPGRELLEAIPFPLKAPHVQ